MMTTKSISPGHVEPRAIFRHDERLSMDQPSTSPQVSIIVPTLNEAENIPQLLPRIDAAMNGVDYEVLIVDDNSKDRTPQLCAEMATRFPLKLLVRTEPKNGLSGAVLHGMAAARGRYLCVM